MNHILIRVFEGILVAFLVTGVASIIINIVTFRTRLEHIARRNGIGRVV